MKEKQLLHLKLICVRKPGIAVIKDFFILFKDFVELKRNIEKQINDLKLNYAEVDVSELKIIK